MAFRLLKNTTGRQNHIAYCQDEEKDTENDRDPEESLLDTTAGGKDTPGIRTVLVT